MIKNKNKKIIIAITLGLFLCLIMIELSLYAVGLLFEFSQEKRNSAALQEKEVYRILCLGDSTTAVGGKDSWPAQLEGVLANKASYKSFSVINKGEILIDSTGILLNLESNLEKYRPSLVVIMAGLNDVKKNMTTGIVYNIKIFLTKFRTYRLMEQIWPDQFSPTKIDYANTENVYKTENTIYNFNKMKEILDKKGIKLVVMQYPLRKVAPLKDMFLSEKYIIIIDNEKVFESAISQYGYERLFIDRFAGDFGHCTKEGNNLIAENIANSIVKDATFR